MEYEDRLDKLDGTIEIGSKVHDVKHMLEINRSNDEMSNFEIKAVCREIAKFVDKPKYDKYGRPIFSQVGIDLMIMICKCYFPRFWEKFDLGQFN
jgi:hypothetical protein